LKNDFYKQPYYEFTNKTSESTVFIDLTDGGSPSSLSHSSSSSSVFQSPHPSDTLSIQHSDFNPVTIDISAEDNLSDLLSCLDSLRKGRVVNPSSTKISLIVELAV
jgi:hypothetical protein